MGNGKPRDRLWPVKEEKDGILSPTFLFKNVFATLAIYIYIYIYIYICVCVCVCDVRKIIVNNICIVFQTVLKFIL